MSNSSAGQPAMKPDANIKPSMVIRQQRNAKLGVSSSPPPLAQPTPPPPPLAAEGEFEAACRAASKQAGAASHHPVLFDRDGLVLPKRLGPQPAGLAAIRDLHRELKFNHTRGKNVLEQKSELKKAMEKLESSKRRREQDQERLSRRTSLEMRLERRAELLTRAEQPTSADHGRPDAMR